MKRQKCTRDELRLLGALRHWRKGYDVCRYSEVEPELKALVTKGWAKFAYGRYWHFLNQPQPLNELKEGE